MEIAAKCEQYIPNFNLRDQDRLILLGWKRQKENNFKILLGNLPKLVPN